MTRLEIDVTSATWKAVKEFAGEKLQLLREHNDAKTSDAIDTAFLRGQIATLKTILALEKAPANPTPGPADQSRGY